MADKNLENEMAVLASKYDNLELKSSQYDESKGQLQMVLEVKGGPDAPSLPSGVEIIGRTEVSAADLIAENPILPANYARANRRLIELDPLGRGDLDLAKPSVLTDSPQSIYKRAIDYYRSKDVYGSHVNVLTNFASKGFENDINDENIKNFYDSWVVDVGFDDIVEKIFFDFFRVGMVRTYKVLGKYEPKINFFSSIPGKKQTAKASKEIALKGNRYTSSFIPIGYTVLNPVMVEIKGSLMFGQTATFLNKDAGKEIKPLLEMKRSQLSTFQRKTIDSLPAAFKAAVLKGEDIPLEPDLIGEVDYRRMPYERYPLPRASRAFEAVEFKDELRKADYSTLDGITNYILLIRVGSDNNPVKKQDTLDRASELFDTVSKSYKVVWNHTLDVQKITSPEIGDILGQDKYRQVNDDLTGGLGIVRALIDGLGDGSKDAIDLAVKSVIEEINYARRQVTRWIYKEYRQLAEAMGFDRIPRVRFDDMALRDEIQMMTIIQGMIDRRLISYRTGQKKLGFDPDTELAQMEAEKVLVANGTLGLVGSPFQQSTQPTQGTPKGTPSEGRPKGKPAKTPKAKDDSKPTKVKVKAKASTKELALDTLTLDEIKELLALKEKETAAAIKAAGEAAFATSKTAKPKKPKKTPRPKKYPKKGK